MDSDFDAAPASATGGADDPTVASVLVAAFLAVLSLYALFSAAAMPVPQGWSTAPALFPILIASLLLLLSLSLIFRWLRRQRRHEADKPGTENGLFHTNQGTRAAALFGLLGIYIGPLLAFLPFEAATTLFLLAIWVAAERRLPSTNGFLAFLLFPFLVALVLSGLFSLPLPGNGSMAIESYDRAARILR
jgi:hypothetical protein